MKYLCVFEFVQVKSCFICIDVHWRGKFSFHTLLLCQAVLLYLFTYAVNFVSTLYFVSYMLWNKSKTNGIINEKCGGRKIKNKLEIEKNTVWKVICFIILPLNLIISIVYIKIVNIQMNILSPRFPVNIYHYQIKTKCIVMFCMYLIMLLIHFDHLIQSFLPIVEL